MSIYASYTRSLTAIAGHHWVRHCLKRRSPPNWTSLSTTNVWCIRPCWRTPTPSERLGIGMAAPVTKPAQADPTGCRFCPGLGSCIWLYIIIKAR